MDLRVATLLVTINEGPRRAQARLDTFSALRRKGASSYQPLAHESYQARFQGTCTLYLVLKR